MASPKLRLIFIVVAAAMFVLWGLSLIPAIESWGNPHEDGFSYVPAFYATTICLPAELFLLAGAIARARAPCRARPLCAVHRRQDALYRGGILDIPAYRQLNGRLRIRFSVSR